MKVVFVVTEEKNNKILYVATKEKKAYELAEEYQAECGIQTKIYEEILF